MSDCNSRRVRQAGALFLLLPALLGLAASVARAEIPLQFAGGEDRWSQQVAAQVLPRSRDGLAALEALALNQYGVRLDGRLRLLMQATPAAAVPEEAKGASQVLKVEAGMGEAELRQRALLQPLRRGMFAVVEELTAGQSRQLPPWLVSGLADVVARQLVAGLRLPALPPYASEPPIHRPEGGNARRAEQWVQAQQRARQSQRASVAAIEALQQRLGADFHPRMKAYLQAAARDGFEPDLVFGQQFGIKPAELFTAIERGAASKAETGDAAGPASLPPDRVQVAVQMGGYVNDDFARQVERDWLGLVRQASAQFDHLVQEVLQVRLASGARIYVGAGVSDYEQILREDMRMPLERAELQGEVSGGLSNSRGQIALKFTPRQSRAAAYDLAVKTTLHELTHELQKQLDNRHAGFSPPAWLREGTADLIAYLLAPQVRINDAEAEALRNWRERNLAWWRSGNKTGLQPEEMVGLAPSGWTRMMKERRGNYQMAGLMSMYLQAITGERFLPAWVAYYRLAGVKGQRASAAFEQAFGLSEAEFHADFKRWLAQQ